MRILMILLLLCCLDLLSARPAEEPTRFTLSNIENNSENVIPSRLERTQELLERVVDAIRIARGRFISTIILARNIIVNRVEQLTNEIQNNLNATACKSEKLQSRRSIQSTTPIVLFHPIPRETARLENETEQAILERRKPDVVRQALNSFLTPKPIVDKIQEKEKYGNEGDKHSSIGRAVVNAYENLSNFLNTLVHFPLNAVRQASRGITQTLDQVGGRLIGLQ